MSYLLDTNVVFRRIDNTNSRHSSIKSKIDDLGNHGETIFITAQNLIEFRNIATRPLAQNGLGYAPDHASASAQEIERLFPLLPDTPAIYTHWRDLVDKYAVCGKQVHDTRLVAVMLTYGVSHLLTLNASDFQRFNEITAVEP